MKFVRVATLLALSFFLAVAVAQDKGASKAGASRGLTDPQIVGIVVAANQIDVDAGKLAKSKTKTKEVVAFADRMITDHTAVNNQASALVKKLGVKAEESDVSHSLKAAARQTAAKLQKLTAAEFDKAYADNEVAYHQQVLDAIDKTLVPNTKNGELRDLLVKVWPAIAAHLDHAKMLQSSLGKK